MDFWNRERASKIFHIPYVQRMKEAKQFAKQNNIKPSISDEERTCLLIIDMQHSFCSPAGELSVSGAIKDVERTCEFIYNKLSMISNIMITLDTHIAMQIFHAPFWVDKNGNHPEPMTVISLDDINSEEWIVSESVAMCYNIDYTKLKQYAFHYVNQLQKSGKFDLCIWPFHAMISSVGNALVSALEEACFFHSIARNTQTTFEVKGLNPLTENYSILRPEILIDQDGNEVAKKNNKLIEKLLEYDKVFICGEAKSHCVAWTISDLLNEINNRDMSTENIFLLEDCTSPVVIPGVIDFT